MSDFTKSDMPSDTQDTFFEESQPDSELAKSPDNNTNFGESQDFHLIDTGVSQDFEADLSGEPTKESGAINTEDASMKKESDFAEKTMDDNENKEDIFDNEDQTMEGPDDDEDIVHGTPPYYLSSPSKKLTANADVNSLKRKAGSFNNTAEDEYVFKKNRLESLERDLLGEPEAMEADTLPLDIVDQVSQKEIDNPDESIIIPETQDSMQNTQPIVEGASKGLEESGNIVEAENTVEDTSAKNLELENDNSLEEECDLVNQNDSTLANDGDLNELKNISGEIDFSGDVTLPEKGEAVQDKEESEKLVENESSNDKVIEKQSAVSKNQIENQIIEKESKVEETKGDKSEAKEKKLGESKPINETQKTKSIEDTLKQLGEEMDTIEHLEQPPTEKESTESELLAALTDSDTNPDVEESENKEPAKMDTEDIPEKIEAKEEVEDKSEDTKSRMSIEVIYDRSSQSQPKPAEVVEIDDDGEKIVLDSSQEDSTLRPEVLPDTVKDETIYKNCKNNSDFSFKSVGSKDYMEDNSSETHLTNGSNDSKKATDSIDSEIKDKISKEPQANVMSEAGVSNQPFYIISDGEGDSIVDDSKNKSSSDNDTLAPSVKTIQVLKDISVCVKLKCLITVDENTKEIVGKELLKVICESMGDQDLSLADVSGNENKDSPSSVTSATYPRFSIMSTSTVSSTTSSSSAGSSKTSGQDNMFSVPKGPAKHAKKMYLELDQLSKEWRNCQLVSMSVLKFANSHVSELDLQNGLSNSSMDENVKKMRESTPEMPQRIPKKGRPPKRLQRGARKRTKVVPSKVSPDATDYIQEDSDDLNSSTVKETRNKSPIAAGSSTPVKKSVEGLRNSVLPTEWVDDLLGKEVFAKWSDNNYYAGKVVDKTKAKYKVNFLDGKNKQLISEFIIPIPTTLNKGLSVYTLTKEGDYGPCGMIVDILESNNTIKYVIEPDEGKRITVQIKDIFLTGDQAQVLREESLVGPTNISSTPQSISKVSLDNMVEGKRRSKRNAQSSQTPKSKKSLTSLLNKTLENEPSVSGMVFKSKPKEVSKSDGGISSDSSFAIIEESGIFGVQKEIIGTFSEKITTKGPQSRLKGKQRNKKKTDDEKIIEELGPIPESRIFEGMSFLLTCAAVESIERYHSDNGSTFVYSNSGNESGTDNEKDWQTQPFVRDRLEQQLIAGGGKVYQNFEDLPSSEYENTKLITNLPNQTAKYLLCLSVGISAYNHVWVIRSCKNNKAVNPSEEKLPAGWSIDKECYVEMFQRREQKPLTHIITVIPCKTKIDRADQVDKDFIAFWSRICENAGGTVRVVDDEDISFVQGTLVLTNHRCPRWAIVNARNWGIPLVSITWLVQSLIEGKILTYDLHKRFKPF